MKVTMLVELEAEDMLGEVSPRVSVRIGGRQRIGYAEGFERVDISRALGREVMDAIHDYFGSWEKVLEAMRPPPDRSGR